MKSNNKKQYNDQINISATNKNIDYFINFVIRTKFKLYIYFNYKIMIVLLKYKK